MHKNKITIIIILLFTLALWLGAIDLSDNKMLESNNISIQNKDIDSHIKVEFSDITTSSEIYSNLRDKCNEYIANTKNTEEKEVYTNKIEIDEEDVYIDNKDGLLDKGNKDKLNSDALNYIEDDIIYMQDKIIVTYVNKLGKIRVVVSEIENPSEKLVTDDYGYYTSDIDDIKQLNTEDEINNTFNLVNIQSEDDEKKRTKEVLNSFSTFEFKEDLYINKIKSIITQENNDDTMLNMYFTHECKDMFKNTIGSLSVTEVRFIEIGKSSIDKEYKDRIFIQLISNDNYYNLVLKLNNNYKIFDIDVL